VLQNSKSRGVIPRLFAFHLPTYFQDSNSGGVKWLVSGGQRGGGSVWELAPADSIGRGPPDGLRERDGCMPESFWGGALEQPFQEIKRQDGRLRRVELLERPPVRLALQWLAPAPHRQFGLFGCFFDISGSLRCVLGYKGWPGRANTSRSPLNHHVPGPQRRISKRSVMDRKASNQGAFGCTINCRGLLIE